jgi:hypothetical protein
MELVIPLIALGSLYMSSKYTNTTTAQNNPNSITNSNGQSVANTEGFTSSGAQPRNNTNALPNVEIIPQNYPIMNDLEIRESSLLEYPNQTAATDKYFNQTIFENQSNNNINTGNNIQKIYSLSGNVLQSDEFTHQNMVPFNSGKIAGRVYDDTYSETILDNMTGIGSLNIKKIEQAPLFKPESHIQYAHGAPNSSDFIQSRMNIGPTRNNVKPWDSISVAPGLGGDGFSSQGKGGFNSGMEDREMWMPKTVDQLRVETNPKMEYSLIGHEGPVQSLVKELGHLGTVDKKMPDTFFVNSPERWLTTTGAQKGEMVRSIQDTGIIKRNNSDVNYMGPAGHAGESNTYAANNYEPSRKELSKVQPILGTSVATHAHPETNTNILKNYVNLNNNRSTTEQGGDIYRNMFGGPIGSVIAPIMNIFTSSRKDDLINNMRMYGDAAPAVPQSYITSSDAPKITNKETTLYTPRAYINNQREGTYLNNNVELPINNRNQSNTSTLGFVGGATTGYGEISYESAYNQTTNNIKSQTIYNRTNQGGMGLLNTNMNINSSKSDYSQQDFRMGPANSVIKLSPSPNTYGTQINPNKTSITEESSKYNATRMDSSLLNAFYENPYTHSLSSVA